ncbi:MAG: tRNA pseudouridine(38-40) synthase TruA [Desulfuromonas sp.]|nr:MAG: tRNA pseudouridine(38-40) synthase TruA [Desulfuromonas sp.]
MNRICLKIEFDGTDFCGSQLQPNGRTVQGQLEAALQTMLEVPVRVHPSGRTDAGVHARGMVVHFDTERSLPASAYREGMNSMLPPDLAVIGVAPVEDCFHARFSATGKRYRYTLLLSQQRRPLVSRYVWRVEPDLDLAPMETAAPDFVGVHDFIRFRTSGCSSQRTVRRIDAINFRSEGNLLHIDVVGSGFLKNMVRRMVGCLVEIGRGQRDCRDIGRMLQDQPVERPALTAPPSGLCLEEVFYDPPPGFR